MSTIRRDLDTRDRRNGSNCQNQQRSHEWFIPKDGIDREVITADICRYLGNDALVRPGNQKDQPGYFVTAYRNLTSAMIQDLKADSQRWDQERRAANSRGHGYTQSRTHETRQHLGPTCEPSQNYPSNLTPQPGYDQFPQATYPPSQTSGSFSQAPPTSYSQLENHYIAGSNMAMEQPRGYHPPASMNGEVPRAGVPQYVQMPVPVSSGQQYSSQVPEPGYSRSAYSQSSNQPPMPINPNIRRGREESNYIAQVATPPSSYQEENGYYPPVSVAPFGATLTSFDSREPYPDRTYAESGVYSSNAMAAPNGSMPPNQQRRDREPDMRDNWNHRELPRRR